MTPSLSTRPYLIRALHQWCVDQGHTPYVAVEVNQWVKVPPAFVQEGHIILNISYEATQGLVINQGALMFQARFSGKTHEIYVPIGRIVAIYARENSEGMAFEAIDEDFSDASNHTQKAEALLDQAKKEASVKPFLKRVK